MPRSSRSFPTRPAIPEGSERPSDVGGLEEVVAELQAHGGIGECITHLHRLPPREAEFGEWPDSLPSALREALAQRGITRPYIHQAETIGHALAGRNTVVITPTASGKSLCYNVPVVHSILGDPDTRAIYLHPTKALSHDQYHELYALTGACGGDIRIYTYDGDTPPATRRALRDSGHIVMTNPDMLHGGILPHHTNWVRLFENLKYVVIDELHHYRGVFGSHLGNVLRRLNRLCAFYGANPTYLCSSATIANPRALAETLTGKPFEMVEKNGAPCGAKSFLFFNPPVVNAELNVRRSPRLEARRVAMRFLCRSHQVILFARSRTDVEVLTTYLKRGMERIHRDPGKVAGYRGGYLPTERRAIEQGLKSGELLGVASTNALELGVDIGSLDVAIMVGWPGTVASARQQSGRAGRTTRESLAVYIAGSSALDQFLVNHPEFLLGSPVEEAHVNPDNITILADHLKCAAFELPFEDGEKFGMLDPAPILQFLEDEKVLRHSANRWHYSSDVYPAEDVGLRGAIGENFIVLDTGRDNQVIAEVDFDSAPFLLHDDAVYIHNGKTYLVEKLDWDRRTAYVHHRVVDYYTDAESSSNIQVLHVDLEEEGPEEGALESRRFGDVNVATEIARFKKVKFESQESIGYGPVTLPQLEIQTEATWLVLRENLAADWKARGWDLGVAIKGVGELLRHTIPLFVLCDRRDFSLSAMVKSKFDRRPAIYLWDRYPGGIGIARRIHSQTPMLLQACAEMLDDCPCKEGCPSCIGPHLEGGSTAKESTLELIRALNR